MYFWFYLFIALSKFGFVFQILGKGSYGAVYKARDLRTSELVAIKVISLSEGVRFYFFTFSIAGSVNLSLIV